MTASDHLKHRTGSLGRDQDEFPSYLQPEQWASWQKKTHDPEWAEHRYRDAKDRAMMNAVQEIEKLLAALAQKTRECEERSEQVLRYDKAHEILQAQVEKLGRQVAEMNLEWEKAIREELESYPHENPALQSVAVSVLISKIASRARTK